LQDVSLDVKENLVEKRDNKGDDLNIRTGEEEL
jgi:hypothetical protein